MEYDPTKLKPYLKQKREATNKELYSLCNATTDNQKGSIRKLKSRILKDIENVETPETPKQKTIKKSNQNSQPPNFIDDPDELLMSVSIRELNRENPDPRWASILITTRKENIGQSKKEGKIRSRFMSMNIKEVARISAKKLTDTSQKPDLKESS